MAAEEAAVGTPVDMTAKQIASSAMDSLATDGPTDLPDHRLAREERVNKAIERLNKCKGKNSQARLENFFGASFTKSSSMKKPEPAKGKGKNKMGAKGAGPAAKKLKK